MLSVAIGRLLHFSLILVVTAKREEQKKLDVTIKNVGEAGHFEIAKVCEGRKRMKLSEILPTDKKTRKTVTNNKIH